SLRQESLLRLVGDFTGELNVFSVNFRFEVFLEVAGFAARHLGGNMKRHGGCSGDSYCSFRSLFGGQPAKKSQIGSRLIDWAEHGGRQAMINSADPLCIGQRDALIIRYRHKGSTGELANEIRKSRQIHSIV